jgi:MacB-like periplasmic core domain
VTRLEERLLAWAERRLDVDLHATLTELEEDRRNRDGDTAARRWRRRELRRALVHAAFATTPAGSRGNLFATILREFRFAIRRLGRLPTHALTFAAIVGTGIGMATFMVETRADILAPEDGVRADAARLTWVTETGQARSGIPLTGREWWLDPLDGPFSATVVTWQSSGDLETPLGILRVQGERVVAGHIARLGGRLAVGRALEATGEMVVSHALWTDRFESDPGVVGRTVRLGNRSATIVGVAEAGFNGPICCVPPAFWEVREPTGTAAIASVFLVDPTDDAAAEAWARRAIEAPGDLGAPRLRHPDAAAFGGEAGFVGRVLAVLLGLAAAVWVTTLLTGANLIVADTLGRRNEYRLRSALGARGVETGARLVTEAALLAAGAAALAVGVAWALATVAPWLLPILGGSTGIRVTIERGTLGVAALAGAVSAVVAALPSIAVALHFARSANVGRGPVSSRFAAAGLGVQVALASSLVVVTGLFLTTLHSLDGEFVGFRNGETGVHFVSATNMETGPTANELLTALGPTAALTARLPVYGAGWDSVTTPSGEAVTFALETVTPGFFDVVGTTLLAGRSARGPNEAVVSRGLVRDLGWGGGAVGRTLIVGDSFPLWISGIVEDATWGSGDVRPTVYRGWGDAPIESAVLLVRGADASVASLLRRLRPLGVALRPFETLDGMLVRSRVIEVFLARLALAFGIVSLLVAAGAVHSHFLRWVRVRERDLSIRRALGAPLPRIGRFLLQGALKLVVPGGLVGIVLGALTARLLSAWLGPMPAVTAPLVAVTVGTVAVVTAFALIGPLRRAHRIHPMTLLRDV